MSKPVIQEWLYELPMMQQTVLLTAIRGPDGIGKYHSVKYLLRWFRRCTLYSAMDGAALMTPYDNNGGSFTGPSFEDPAGNCEMFGGWEPRMDEIAGQYLRSLDELPHHFQLHFLHAAEIVGYKHPVERTRKWWAALYLRLVHDLHLWPETEAQLDRRLGDNREQWLERNDMATVA
jgi:hypothetical protein